MDCSHCHDADLSERFEMDGHDETRAYRASGLWWRFCRGCGRHFLVENEHTGHRIDS